MDKSPDAFRTISEVAEHLETPAHVLRFWESRFPQIKPVKRAGGRRYYRPSDVSLLRGIKRLLHDEGMTIRGVQKILREQGVRHVAGLSGDAVFEDTDDTAIDAVIAEAVVLPKVSAPIPFRAAPGLAEAMAKAVAPGHAAAKPAASTPLPVTGPAQGALLLTPAEVPERLPEPGVDPAGSVEADGDGADDAAADDIAADDAAYAAEAARDAGAVDGAGQSPATDLAALEPMLPEFDDSAVSEFVQAAQADDAAAAADATLADDGGDSVSDQVAADVAADAGKADWDDADFCDDDFDGDVVPTLAARVRGLPKGASAARVGAELLDVVARLHALRAAMAAAAQADGV